jgi:hypothetical protein
MNGRNKCAKNGAKILKTCPEQKYDPKNVAKNYNLKIGYKKISLEKIKVWKKQTFLIKKYPK